MNSKVTIVMYHYVRDLAASAYPDIKGLDLELFLGQIDHIRRNYTVIRMEELIAATENGTSLPPNAALLTFDDGYIDHYTNVFPVLQAHGMQGSFFIPAKAVAEHCLLDVNKIHFLLAATPDKSRILDDLRVLLDRYRDGYQLQSFDVYFEKLAIANRFDPKEVIFIKRLLQVELDETLRGMIADELFEKYVGRPVSEFARELYVSKTQLKEMSAAGMHIGCHGYDHYWWNRLSAAQMANEIDRSLDFLREVGADIGNWTACYPYGSCDERSAAILKANGCRLAFTTRVDIADLAIDDPFLLPRLDTNDLPQPRIAIINASC